MFKLFDAADSQGYVQGYVMSSMKFNFIKNNIRNGLFHQLTKGSNTYYCYRSWKGQIKLNLRSIIFKEKYEIRMSRIKKLYFDISNDMMLINDDMAVKMNE